MPSSQLIKDFLQKEIAVGHQSPIVDDTQLISSGILDSINKLKLVTFLEKTFKVEIDAQDASDANLGTVTSIVNMIDSKLGHQKAA